jgi:hypothetical protein
VRTQLLSALVIGVISALQLSAQNTSVQHAASLAGIVRDSGSLHYPRTFSICTWVPRDRSMYSLRCAQVDTLGSYRLDNLPLTGLRISVQCETLRGYGKSVASDSVVFSDTGLVRRDWVVPSVGCDLRPMRQVTGIFRGHYTPGFESSEFIPCKADAWFIPSDSLNTYPYDAKHAWASWRAASRQKLNWTPAPRDQSGNPTYYVRWRGTVVGPGRYGHLGVAPFRFFVDSVLELRAPGKKDCR